MDRVTPLQQSEPPPSPAAAVVREGWIDRAVRSPAVRSGYLSLTVHLLLCILLALVALEDRPDRRTRPLILGIAPASTDDAAGATDDAVAIGLDAHEAGAADTIDVAAAAPPADEPPPLADAADLLPRPELVEQPGVAPATDLSMTAVADVGTVAQPVSVRGGAARSTVRPGTVPTRGGAGGGIDGPPFAARRGEARGAAVRGRGGNAASEAAVERGLAWLAAHQAVDGSWQFDLSGCRCNGACRDPGTLSSSTASTAIALLPFLGAGHTHADGRHRETVSRGIYYLLSRMQRTPRGADFCEGTMYGHGVTTLVLAEAYGMTRDDLLVQPVRDALRFIETSQDMHGGGWRYLPGQAGDITVTAWQLTALKSGQLAGLEPPSPTIDGVRRFLDRVQAQHGAAYGYRTPAAKPCTSAIGLLCRMYTGWGTDQEPLVRGVTQLAKPDPAVDAVYQNFYLAQALVQMNHPRWPRWNVKYRDQLVARQARLAHEAGSWFFADADTAPGGRLAHTALAVLSLEVYYRLLPIYRQEAVDTGF